MCFETFRTFRSSRAPCDPSTSRSRRRNVGSKDRRSSRTRSPRESASWLRERGHHMVSRAVDTYQMEHAGESRFTRVLCEVGKPAAVRRPGDFVDVRSADDAVERPRMETCLAELRLSAVPLFVRHPANEGDSICRGRPCHVPGTVAVVILCERSQMAGP